MVKKKCYAELNYCFLTETKPFPDREKHSGAQQVWEGLFAGCCDLHLSYSPSWSPSAWTLTTAGTAHGARSLSR